MLRYAPLTHLCRATPPTNQPTNQPIKCSGNADNPRDRALDATPTLSPPSIVDPDPGCLGGATQVPYTPWLPQEHGGEPTAAAAYATAEAAAKARGTNICGEARGFMMNVPLECRCARDGPLV